MRPAEVRFLVLTDGLFALLVIIGLLFVAAFIFSLIAAGDANAQDKTDTFVYIAGVGAAPWVIAALISFGLAGLRAKAITDEF